MEIAKRNINHIIIYNMLNTAFIKGGSLIVSLVSLPIYMRYFGNKSVLGLWLTLSAVINWIIYLDLGVGNGLRNKLTVTITHNDSDLSKKYISSAYVITSAMSFFAIIIFIAVYRKINWNNFFNVSTNIITPVILEKVILIVFSGVMFQFTLKLITSILFALQKTALVNANLFISSVINLSFVMFFPKYDLSTNLLIFSIVNAFAINFPLLITTLFVFLTDLKGLRPTIDNFSIKYSNVIFKIGMLFFHLQIMFIAITGINEFIITKFISPDYVQEYTIYNKLFGTIISIYSIILTPIWSSVTHQFAVKNYKWIKKLFDILQIASVLATVFSLAFCLFINKIVDFWIKDVGNISVNPITGMLFAFWTGLIIWNSSNSSIANGLGWLKPQMVFLTIGALLNIILSIVLITLSGNWTLVLFANIFSLLPICIIQPLYLSNRLNNEITNMD